MEDKNNMNKDKNMYRVVGIIMSLVLLIIICNIQKDWISYVFGQKKCKIVEATILEKVDINFFKKGVVLQYDEEHEWEMVNADLRDKVGEKIIVAVTNKGNVWRTTFFLPDNVINWYVIIGFILLILFCFIGYKQSEKREYLNPLRTDEELQKENEKQQRFDELMKTDVITRLIILGMVILVLIFVNIFLY